MMIVVIIMIVVMVIVVMLIQRSNNVTYEMCHIQWCMVNKKCTQDCMPCSVYMCMCMGMGIYACRV